LSVYVRGDYRKAKHIEEIKRDVFFLSDNQVNEIGTTTSVPFGSA
jgi:hypothetical protein